MMKNKSKTKQITYTLAITVVALVGLLILTRGITYAKYVSNSVLNYYLNSKGFYFRSDDLTTETKNNVDTSWDGDKVSFTINNSSNKSLATEYDIEYEITCSIEETDSTKVCYLNGTNSSKVTQTLSADFACKDTTNKTDVSSLDETTCTKQGYTWTSIPNTSTNYFEVIDINGKDVDTANVIITATSTSPYKKTIKGKYTLNKDKSELGTLSLKYETKTHYENVIVTNSYNEDKCIKLTWNSDDLVIDNSNSIQTITNDNNYINGVIFKLNKKDSTNFIFYKQNKSKTYSEADFALVESTECQ